MRVQTKMKLACQTRRPISGLLGARVFTVTLVPLLAGCGLGFLVPRYDKIGPFHLYVAPGYVVVPLEDGRISVSGQGEPGEIFVRKAKSSAEYDSDVDSLTKLTKELSEKGEMQVTPLKTLGDLHGHGIQIIITRKLTGLIATEETIFSVETRGETWLITVERDKKRNGPSDRFSAMVESLRLD